MSDTPPTAIIPRTGSFNRRYDAWAEQLADPLEVLFRNLLHGDPDVRYKAAALLLDHRHAKPKSAQPPPLIGTVNATSLIINMPPRPALPPHTTGTQVVDVTPRALPALEEMLK